MSLVGNGPSVVYNAELAIEPLTDGIVTSFSALAGTDAGDALAGFARQVTNKDRTDFEGILGPLDAITQALPLLGGVAAPFGSVPWIAEPLQHASDALRRLHALGLATALDLIATRAQACGQDAIDRGPGALVTGLRAAAAGDLLTIATLNYDGLLQGCLTDEEHADLATGLGSGAVQLLGQNLTSWPLRTSDDIPPDRTVHLLHLHGSLGWLRVDGQLRKFRIADLRAAEFWRHLAAGTVDAQPVVVLTDRKDPVVATYPFALAYSVFRDRLIATEHWCVAGYSFLDVPVNNALIAAVRARRAAGLTDPKLLILGLGDITTLENLVGVAMGASTPEHLFVDGTGLPDSVGAAPWQEWHDT